MIPTFGKIFGGPGRTWTYHRTILSPCTVFYTGFYQVILTNINSILTLIFTNTKCYWMVLNIMADRHLYGHLNPWLLFLCIICCLVCGNFLNKEVKRWNLFLTIDWDKNILQQKITDKYKKQFKSYICGLSK